MFRLPIGERDTYHNQEGRGGNERPFWQLDEAVGEGLFYGEKQTIRLKAHISEEPYYRAGALDEIVPLQSKSGSRVYVLARPYILLPDYRISVDLYPQPTKEGIIGKVVSSNWVGISQRIVGQAQGWHYPQKRTLVLWECFLEDRYRQKDPRTDETLHSLWKGFEGFLFRHLSGVEHIATPSWEPLYEDSPEAWPQFLELMGYASIGDRAFGKRVIGPDGTSGPL